jgi:sterol 24-C-methyltransferase
MASGLEKELLMRTLVNAARTGVNRDQVFDAISSYRALHDDSATDNVEERREKYATLVNHYYDLVTDFYEFGWGQSFHFAARYRGESLAQSILRHEHYLALKLGLGAGMDVLDVGCGIGGPARNIAQFTGARLTGINNNAYQVGRADQLTAGAGLTSRCKFVKADFMSMPLPDCSFDAAYAIEATCHAPDRVGVYEEIYRVLKPGGLFASYEWCMTEHYDPSSVEQRRIKKGIEEGDGLPNLIDTKHVLEALGLAGFAQVASEDLALAGDSATPWHLPLSGKEFSWRGLHLTSIGRRLSHRAVWLMERLRLAPKGATEVSAVLNTAAEALVAGGERGIFTPMFFFVARRP